MKSHKTENLLKVVLLMTLQLSIHIFFKSKIKINEAFILKLSNNKSTGS